MIRWTSAGAVEEPTSVQIRVAPAFQGRVRAGAPTPARSMTTDEVRANVRWFARDRVGPRAAACTALVLSGVEEAAPLVEVIAEARALGIERITWHLGAGAADPTLAGAVDVVVRVARGPWDLDAEVPAGPRLHVVVPLEEGVLVGLDRIARWLVDRAPAQVVFQWPFPTGDALPPDAADAATAVRGAVALLDAAGIPAGVKGLPPCILSPGAAAGRWAERSWRSANRWYVDVDHQQDRALIFFPDLVRLAKVDGCRFCRAAPSCEGVAESWLLQGRVGLLTPLRDP